MKSAIVLLLFCMSFMTTAAQNVDGKWVGKLTQTPGGFKQLYDLELDINQKKSLSGESYAYLDPFVYARFGFEGRVNNNQVRLREIRELIYQDVAPPGWVLCVKNFTLTYRKAGNREYLEGTWDGNSVVDPTDECLPGSVILARSREDLRHALDSISAVSQPTDSVSTPVAAFSPVFLNTTISKVSEIEVKNRIIEVQLRDYLNVDNDTISLYMNRKELAKHVSLTKRAKKFTIELNKDIPVNELLIYAENLGKIPPNTSEMIIMDGMKAYRMIIQADKQKTAAIYLKYSP